MAESEQHKGGLEERWGPLPAWGWLVVVGAGVAFYFLIYKKSSSTNTTPTNTLGTPYVGQTAAPNVFLLPGSSPVGPPTSGGGSTGGTVTTGGGTSGTGGTSGLPSIPTSPVSGTNESVASKYAGYFPSPTHPEAVATLENPSAGVGGLSWLVQPGSLAGSGPTPLFFQGPGGYWWVPGPTYLSQLSPGTTLYTYGTPSHLASERSIAAEIFGSNATPASQAVASSSTPTPIYSVNQATQTAASSGYTLGQPVSGVPSAVSNVPNPATLPTPPSGYTWVNMGREGGNEYPTYQLERL